MRSLTLSKMAMLLLAVALVGIPLAAQEQQRPEQQPQSQQQQQVPAQPNTGQDQAQTFSGKISASSGDAQTFELKDEATNATYKLDNAEQAKLFAGKDVKVTGTLDPATNTIRVQKIELSPSPRQ